MQQTTPKAFLTPLFTALLFVACSGSSTSNQSATGNLTNGEPTQVSLALQLTSSTATPAAKIATKENGDGSFSPEGSAVTLTTAQATLERIELYLPEGTSCSDVGFVATATSRCEDETEIEDGVSQVEAKIKLFGPLTVDLMTGQTTPAVDTLNIPSGIYRRVDIRLNNLSAIGNFVDANAVSHGFNLAFDFNEEIKVKNAAGFEVTTNTLNRLILAFDVEKWFAGVDLATCVADGNLQIGTDDSLHIGDDSTNSNHGSGNCNNIENTIRDNIKDSSIFFNDKNGDGSNDDPATHDVGDDNGGHGNDDGANHT